ncbi:hypothetical protein [Bartonella koehlerae]|nr:hypothetical protein [Bartonella koehlerae]
MVVLKEVQGLGFLTTPRWGILERRGFLKLQLMMPVRIREAMVI